jgi:iron complex transport system ATP-binding protein
VSAPQLEVVDLSFTVGSKTILNGISFELHAGEFLAIIGPNGAGKTTLIKCLNRIHADWSGQVQLNGQPLHSLSRKVLARHLSYVPQADGREWVFTVNNFVMLGRYPHLSPFSSVTAQDRKVVADSLALTGSTEFADRDLTTLSGGERQKVLIAAALAQEAQILLLDEPTTYLDYRHQMEVLELLHRLHGNGLTIVMVTHDINGALHGATRMLALKNGRVSVDTTPQGLLAEGVLASVFDTPFAVTRHPETGQPVVLAGGPA